MNPTPIRALLVTDTAPALLGLLQHDTDIAVVGHVSSARDALAFVHDARPDIVVIDLNLADGSSQQAIEQIMDQAPTPILVLSAAIENGRSARAVEALVAGALDALPTPAQWTAAQGADLRETVRRLSKAWVIRHLRGGRTATPTPATDHDPDQHPVVAMAASTGGPSALASLLAELGGLAAPVLIVQHLHPEFTEGLLEWMSRVSALPVEVARHRQPAQPGHVYLAPGSVHLKLGPRSHLELSAQPVSVHRPSADVLFASVAEQSGSAAIGVVLTGMGDDGAQGLLAIRRQGGRTLAQNEQTCAVFGMPRAAQRLGAVTELLPLSELGAAIRHAVNRLTKAYP